MSSFTRSFKPSARKSIKLTDTPKKAVNAQIDGKEIVYHDYADIGIAVGGGKGLVVPVLKNAERMGFAEIEKRIRDFGARARSGDLALDELQGGTFTITNGDQHQVRLGAKDGMKAFQIVE